MAGTGFVEWNDMNKFNNGADNSGKLDYLRLESGKTFRIRPVFRPIKFYKYFYKNEGRLRTAICEDPDVCPVRDKFPDLPKATQRYACYVLDRSDGKLKIIEAPQTVFRPMGNHAEATGKNPGGGKEGSDWLIKVTGSGLKTKYDVTFLDITPLESKEVEYIKEAVGGDQESLKKIYAVDTPEKIEQKLFGDPASSDSEQSDTGKTNQEESSSESNSDFNW